MNEEIVHNEEEEELHIDLWKLYDKIDTQTMILILMALFLVVMYMYHVFEIDRCNAYFNGIIRNMTMKGNSTGWNPLYSVQLKL